jgi:predicted DNA-binding transcriptional regulator
VKNEKKLKKLLQKKLINEKQKKWGWVGYCLAGWMGG